MGENKSAVLTFIESQTLRSIPTQGSVILNASWYCTTRKTGKKKEPEVQNNSYC